jgi:hypothetical protein
MHPVPIVWLVCASVCDLVHSLVCSLIPQIKSDGSAEHDSKMHLPNLPKGRLPIAPRTWKELSFQVDLVLFNASIYAQ